MKNTLKRYFSDCGTLVVPNGVFTGDTFFDGTAYVTCSTGYDGSGAAVCGSSGKWTTEPTCISKGNKICTLR